MLITIIACVIFLGCIVFDIKSSLEQRKRVDRVMKDFGGSVWEEYKQRRKL